MQLGKNDYEWVLRGMGSRTNLDSSLTGKLRNQIGLLSPSVFLLPHLFNLERIAVLRCTNVVLSAGSYLIFLLYLFPWFYLCAKEAGYGLSDVDAISRHSVSVVAQLPHIRAFINAAKEPFWDVRQYHLLLKSWHWYLNVFLHVEPKPL